MRAVLFHAATGGVVLGLCAIAPALAYDDTGTCWPECSDAAYFLSDVDPAAAAPDDNVILRGSLGVARLEAREKVFWATSGDDLLSLLVWRSTAPIASGDIKVRFPGEWTLRGRIDAAIGGDSMITDYDWMAGYVPDLWTHRSVHPDTSLDWYLDGTIAIGRDLPVNEALSINVNGGVKYTDVKWTARGGSYIYSVDDFRDTTGTFPDVAVGDYRLHVPTAFIGIDARVTDGPWSLDTAARAGLTFGAGATDNHYLRDLRFEDGLDWAQVVSAEARLGYAFTDNLGAFLEASYEKMVSGHGDTHAYDTTTGALDGVYEGAAGAEFEAMSIKLGLKGNF